MKWHLQKTWTSNASISGTYTKEKSFKSSNTFAILPSDENKIFKVNGHSE